MSIEDLEKLLIKARSDNNEMLIALIEDELLERKVFERYLTK